MTLKNFSRKIWQVELKVVAHIFVVLLTLNCEAKADIKDKLAIPVYFVTDRELVSETSAGLNYADIQLEQNKLNFGVKNIVLVGADAQHSSSDRSSGLGWWTPTGNPTDKSIVATKTLSEAELLSDVKAIVDSGDRKRPLVLFVHGCCQPYKSSIEAAAKVEHALEAPVILYSWCSIGPTEKFYRDNELRQRGGGAAFYQFLQKLETQIPPEKIVIVAHSMGNRFVHEALKTRQWNRGQNLNTPKFRDVILACADVNAGDFSKDQHNVAFNCQKLIITHNNTDPALALSILQRGVYPRLGASGWTLSKLIQNGDAEIYDIQEPYRGKHDLPMPVIVDLIRSEEGGWMNKFLYLQKKPHLFEVR